MGYAAGRLPQITMVIVDSKSVENEDTAGEKGYDAEKTSSIKLHLAVDTNGLPHAMCITTANVSDRDGVLKIFGLCAPNPTKVKKVLCDGGYSGDKFAREVAKLINAKVEVVKHNEMHKFVVIPILWVVERSFAWLDKCRRL